MNKFILLLDNFHVNFLLIEYCHCPAWSTNDHVSKKILGAVDLSNKNVTVDVLGDAHEYLIKRFADENKDGTMVGQF